MVRSPVGATSTRQVPVGTGAVDAEPDVDAEPVQALEPADWPAGSSPIAPTNVVLSPTRVSQAAVLAAEPPPT